MTAGQVSVTWSHPSRWQRLRMLLRGYRYVETPPEVYITERLVDGAWVPNDGAPTKAGVLYHYRIRSGSRRLVRIWGRRGKGQGWAA